MDIRELKYFVQVADYGNFSLAAERLYISQPALSKVVQKLESELGCDLFYADQRQQKLTLEGRALYQKACRVLRAFEEIGNLSDPPEASGVIHLGFPPVAGNTYFCDLISGFSARYPGIKLQLKEEGSYHIMEDIDAGQLDVGCVLQPIPTEKYHCALLARDISRLVVSARHPLAGRERVPLRELQNEKFILLGAGFLIQNTLGEACRKLGFEPNVIQTSSQWDYIVQMVRLNTGITFLPEALLRRYEIPDVSILDVDEVSLSEELVLIAGKASYCSYRVSLFVSYVTQMMAEMGMAVGTDCGKKEGG